ncbi:MAG: pyridoxal phosphate-dependent decarboxylase family protein [Alphaproteobacteria bacterium]
MSRALESEETLDPASWDDLRALGHRMIEDMIDHLATVRERPAWRPMPPGIASRLQQPLPLAPEGAERAYADFVEAVLPYPTGNTHPRFWGWVMGTGSGVGMLAEMLAAGMNCCVVGNDDAASRVETQVIAWCKAMLGYPPEASGLLVSGGSVANLVGLAVARSSRAGFDVRARGLTGASRRLTLYGSRETHSSVERAVELLGLGGEALRKIPVDGEYRIDLRALATSIADDRAAGHQPLCVIGNAGTVNTGAFDDLTALAAIAEREGMWFHVDGAFGALAALSPELRPRVAGMARADSLAFDLHKWMYMPYEVGCTLVRSEPEHRGAFAYQADYLAPPARGLAARAPRFRDYGLQLSRGFLALKVWMCLKADGVETYRRLIEQNVAQARYLARLIAAAPELELLAPVPLNIVCFRYVGEGARSSLTSSVPPTPSGSSEVYGDLDALNRELLCRLHESGVAVPSSTVLGGRYALRVAVANHRSRRADFDLLVREVVRLGRELR